jgi:hypothetical protein
MSVNITALQEQATLLGFSFAKGPGKFSGYVLINDATGEQPLGADYSASLADIDKYLSSHRTDSDIDELESGIASKPIPARQIKKANDILLHKQTKGGVHNRLLLDYYARTKAWGEMSPEEFRLHLAKQKAAQAGEDKAKAARLPKPTIPLRTTAINSDHPFAQERGRQSRVFRDADERWVEALRTNVGSLLHGSEQDDEFYRDRFMDPEKERQRLFAEHLRNGERTKPDPDGPDYLQVRPVSGGFAVSTTGSHVPKEISRESRDAAVAKLKEQRLVVLASEIRQAIERKQKLQAGTGLAKARKLLEHGSLISWIEDEIGISARTAQRYLQMVDAKLPNATAEK